MARIRRIRMGGVNAWLVSGNRGWLLVDAGMPGMERTLLRALKRHGISPKDIRLIVVTHVHHDHVGSLAAVKEACGCPVSVHADGVEPLRNAEIRIPDGRCFPFSALMRFFRHHRPWVERLLRYRPVTAEIIIDQETSLEPYGFPARILPLPGHTDDSMAVLFDDGSAFVGDLAVNHPLLGFASHVPPLLTDESALRASWKALRAAGAAMIYPAHGTPFSVDELQ